MREVNKSNGFSLFFWVIAGLQVREGVWEDYQRERQIEEEKKWEGVCDNQTREERRSPGIACRSTESSEMQRF